MSSLTVCWEIPFKALSNMGETEKFGEGAIGSSHTQTQSEKEEENHFVPWPHIISYHTKAQTIIMSF